MLTVLLENVALLGVINWINRVDSTDSIQMIHSPTNRTSLLYTLNFVLFFTVTVVLLQKPWNKINVKKKKIVWTTFMLILRFI